MAAPATARADGKFYFRDEIPAKEPYQRAMLAWQDGRELLVIQPHLLGKAEEFAWVLPVPGEPEVGAMKAAYASDFFDDLARASSAWPVPLRPMVPLGLLLAWGIILLRIRRKMPRLRWLLTALAGVLVISIVAGSFVPTLLRGRISDAVDDDEAVSILRSEKLGIYSTQVVRANEPGAMMAWLAKNGYRAAAEDDDAIGAYESKHWRFVISRISTKLEKEDVDEGMLDALVLAFASPEPVYPFALTATNGGETQLVLYAFADHKLVHPAMTLRFSGAESLEKWGPARWIDRDDPAAPPLPGYKIRPGLLSKLKGRLSSRNSSGDVVLTRADDDSPYRGYAFAW